MIEYRKYLDVAHSQAPPMGIEIVTLGHHTHLPNHSYPDHSHPASHYFEWEKGRRLTEYQMLYIAKGSGNFEATGLPPQSLTAGTVLLLYPEVWHRYKPTIETGWEEYWIGFTGQYAHYLLEQTCFSPQNPIIKIGLNEAFLESFGKLLKIVEQKEESYQTLSSFVVIQMLGILYTSALMGKESMSKKEEIIQEIQNVIHKSWQNDIDFDQLSTQFNVSYVWFRKAFKEILGTSPHQYHLNIRLRKAEQMIQESSKTLSEIAFLCGFESEFYFSRIFKQKMGYKASEIRKNKKGAETP